MSRRLLPGIAAREDIPSGLLDRLVAIAVTGGGPGDDRAAVWQLAWTLCDRSDLGAERARALAASDPDTAVVLARSGLLSPADVDPAARPQAALALLDEGSGRPGWARLLAASPDREIRWRLASCPGLPPDVAQALAADPDPGVAAEIALWTADPALAARLASHPDAEVRSAAALNGATPPEVLTALVTGEGLPPARSCPVCGRGEAPAPYEPPARARCSGAHESAVHDTLERAARNPATPASVAEGMAGHPSVLVRWALAERADLPQEVYARLGADPAVAVRRAVAENPAIREPLIRTLAARRDDPDVLRALARHPRLPLDVLAEVASAVRIGPVLLPSVAAADPEDLARAAASSPAAVRMLITERHDLPAPLRDALADDADAAVARAAAPHPGLSGEQLRAMVARHGGQVCARVAANPGAPADLLEELARRDPPVRRALRAIAVHPNATPAALLVCLEDARACKDAAAHPALPAAVVVRLLDHPCAEVAWAAVGHPALPVAAVERLVAEAERAGPGGRAPG
ncbi:hypothetical protein C0216_18300 [Streptomyces globosus]|uniref:Leucine rich repeat variant n=1 Tax=Streptomyces globosus TaxID=68209 RepID=A0A344U2L5_9ACTN|nr:hypothetical protein [Streptomyces globosus]AXE25136.1 hypothetical protein C0216_18300 [Streptomyces globosus]